MDFSLLSNVLTFSVQLALPILAAAVFGAIIAGILRVATQIDDDLISLVGKTVLAGILLYMVSGSISTSILDFTKNIWANVESYK